MNIEELNERIEQLTNLVKTSEETISQLKETLKSVEQERDRLADKRRELEPKFERAEKNDCYYSVQLDNSCRVIIRREEYCYVDNNRYNLPNYFHTEERAQEVLDEIKFLLKLERLHDIYCPDYKPDWDSLDKKYFVWYSHDWHRYICSECTRNESAQLTYFPTAAIAQKVRDILNKENGITTEGIIYDRPGIYTEIS